MTFTTKFDSYVCEGDRITATVDGFDLVATIMRDDDAHIDDDDSHNVDQSVTGCDDAQQEKLLAAREAWSNDEWFYCGVVVNVYKAGVELGEASLWSIEANYPDSDNGYLAEVANELVAEAMQSAKAKLAELCA